MTAAPDAGPRPGRPPATGRGELERVALDLFLRDGFTSTTVDDIAEAAGISRRTFFRYYASKNDVVWGDFDALLMDLERRLGEVPDEVPLVSALADAVVRFNELAPEAAPAHRRRMSLILRVPALQAHGTLRYAGWRDVIVRFAARRLNRPVDDLLPRLIGHVALGTALAAYEQWLADETAELGDLIRTAFETLEVRLPAR